MKAKFIRIIMVGTLLGMPIITTLPVQAAETSAVQRVYEISDTEDRWAEIKYSMSDEKSQLQAFEKLAVQTDELMIAQPDDPAPKIWKATILSTAASIQGGLAALPKVKESKKLLEEVIKTNPEALDGQAQYILGALYYKVPGWPVAFGDDDAAEKYLVQALRINPDNRDANYFYGDFLREEKQYEGAEKYLTRALNIADDQTSVAADGRRNEILDALEAVKETSNQKSYQYKD